MFGSLPHQEEWILFLGSWGKSSSSQQGQDRIGNISVWLKGVQNFIFNV